MIIKCPACRVPVELCPEFTQITHTGTGEADYLLSLSVRCTNPPDEAPASGPPHQGGPNNHLRGDDFKVRTMVSKALVAARNAYTAKGERLPTAVFKGLQSIAKDNYNWEYERHGKREPIVNFWIDNIFKVRDVDVYRVQELLGLHTITEYCEESP